MAGETVELIHMGLDLEDATVVVTAGGDEVSGATAEVTNVFPDLISSSVEITLVDT